MNSKISMSSLFLIILISILLQPLSLRGQLPETQIYLVSINQDQENKKNNTDQLLLLSHFNPDGYNNQPFFSNAQTILLSSGKEDSTNLVQLDLETKELKWITKTAESEFSPGIHPHNKGTTFVRLEKDGIQRLWNIPPDRTSYGNPITPLNFKVGYYQILKDGRIALYLLREDYHELVIWDPVEGEEYSLTKKPGRSLHQDSAGKLYYVIKESETLRHLYSYDPDSGKEKLLVRMIPEASEDFCIGPQNWLLSSVNGMIMKFDPEKDAYWQPHLKIKGLEGKTITRLSSNQKNLLCIVVID